MSRLQKVVNNTKKEPGFTARLKGKTKEIPNYNMSGKYSSPKLEKQRRRMIITVAAVAAAVAFVYLPQIFMKDGSSSASDYSVTLDSSAVTASSQVLRDNPNADFDGDGLANSEETSRGTDPWNVDSDGDGATDYYEVNNSDTDPLKADSDILTNLQTRNDKEKGESTRTPYKIGNVIFWADNEYAKANGTAIETLTGYRFYNFSGYVQFDDGSKYAYRVDDGVHTLLEERTDMDNVWYIDGNCEVETYAQPLQEVTAISTFGHTFYPDTTAVTRLLGRILPSDGFITAQNITIADIDPDYYSVSVPQLKAPDYDKSDSGRLENNTNSLSNLSYVMDEVDAGECVAVSLYRDGGGEFVGVVYGYDSYGYLYIADAETLEPAGAVLTVPTARKMVGKDGDLAVYSWFEFSGMGFNSAAGDRISFFAVTTSQTGSGSDLAGDAMTDFEKSGEAEEEGTVKEQEPGDPDETAAETAGNMETDTGGIEEETNTDDGPEASGSASVGDSAAQAASAIGSLFGGDGTVVTEGQEVELLDGAGEGPES